MKPVYQFRALVVSDQIRGLRGTLTVCVEEDTPEDVYHVIFDSNAGERSEYDGMIIWLDEDQKPVPEGLPEADRELGDVKFLGMSDMIWDLYNRLPVSADRITTVTAVALVVPNARPR